MKLFSKDNAVELVRSGLSGGRLSHAYLLHGDHGVGKKTLAMYMAAQMLCEQGSGVPCGKCKSCRMMSNGAHPDLITVAPSGKSGNYLADDLRAIIPDASVVPNEGLRKIYFLPRIDKALPAAQNVLLKIVEEPPAHVVFIMTAESREMILKTILSRTVSLAVSEPKESECAEALREKGFTPEQYGPAVKIYGGNIGKCLEYLSGDEEAAKIPAAVRASAEALAAKDEFAFLSELTKLERDREGLLNTFAALKNVIRDAVAAKLGCEMYSLCRDTAEKLSGMFRQSALEKMYDDIAQAEIKISSNGSAQLCLGDLSGRLFRR